MSTNEEEKNEQYNRNTPPETSEHFMICSNTPKRPLLQKCFSTPLRTIKERQDAKGTEEKTPLRSNPFDVKAETLLFPSCSPSIFATFARNKSNKGTFRWSIEHLSFLHPADIDETSIPDPWVDPDEERKAQQAIDIFFSQNSIVPSPWAQDSLRQGRSELRTRRISRSSSLQSECLSNDAATQTSLTIPPNVDLMALLGSFFTFKEGNENSADSSKDNSFRDSDTSNTSSLRRKLFTADDYYSPPRLERKDLYAAKQWCTSTVRSLQSTPSDVLSSSPISPSNCSDFCNIPISPHVSPIASAPRKTGIRVMQSFTERLKEENMLDSSSKLSCQSMCTAPDDSLNFYMESQEAIAYPTEKSEKQDTGYITGSMSSSQNLTSDATCSLPSRITPVAQLIKDWDISMSNTNNISYMNECASANADIQVQKTHFVPCNYETWLQMPNFCSTPSDPAHL